MTRSLLLLLTAAAAFAAGDPWAKVKELKSGTEIRIARKGVPQPLEAKLDEVRDDAVVIVLKNEQTAIPKEEIDRLDYRPKSGSRVTAETKSSVERMETKPAAGMSHSSPVPGQTYSSGVNVGSKPAYETVYRRQTGAPPPAKK